VSRVLVYIETLDDSPVDTSLQAVGLAQTLGEVETVSVQQVLVPASTRNRQLDHPLLSDYAPEALGEALAQLVAASQPDAVLAAATDRGNEVMAHLAAILDEPLATNVTSLRPTGSDWELTRLRWGGSLFEEARLTARVKLATVAPHTCEPVTGTGTGPIEIFTPDLGDELTRTRVVERVQVSEGVTLTTAPVVVSGGRGVGSEEGFAILEELAALLGGAVGCSRVVTNNGWRSHASQVGQTGTRVAPNLYIACGISGAIQHWVGMMASKTILAINIDPESPMVTRADYAVVGDLHPILEAVVAEVKRRRS
jgi:electron transfer flavoprotein alpha subunit